jgi:cytochrome c6
MKKILIFLFVAVWISACADKGTAGNKNAAEIGVKVYKQYCLLCHGVDGKLGLNGAKDLTVCKLTEAERILQVTEGKNTMTPFKNVLSPDEIKAVVAYTFTLK